MTFVFAEEGEKQGFLEMGQEEAGRQEPSISDALSVVFGRVVAPKLPRSETLDP